MYRIFIFFILLNCISVVLSDTKILCFKIIFSKIYIFKRILISFNCFSEYISIVLPRSNDHVYICLFVNIEIKTSGWHIQQSGVVLKTIRYQHV